MLPEQAQKIHYDRLAGEYEAHYSDGCSQLYREQFIERPLLEGLDLRGRQVLEAMCGSGQTTKALLARGAEVTGLDISEASIRTFRERWPQCRTVCAPLARSELPAESFDAVVVVLGLHHLQPAVHAAIDEIHRVLKVGGMFCFMEPHVGSVPDWFRKRWYSRDPLFLANEAAIDLDSLKAAHANQFEPIKESYGGNVAYLMVLNSMVFRVPLRLKRLYTPSLLRMEGGLGRFQGKRLACFAISQWRKK